MGEFLAAVIRRWLVVDVSECVQMSWKKDLPDCVMVFVKV